RGRRHRRPRRGRRRRRVARCAAERDVGRRSPLSVTLDVLAIAAGIAIVAATALSAIATFVVPRGVAARLTRIVFIAVRRAFDVRMKLARTYERGESAMAWYALISLLLLVVVWLILLVIAFTLIFHGLGISSWT